MSRQQTHSDQSPADLFAQQCRILGLSDEPMSALDADELKKIERARPLPLERPRMRRRFAGGTLLAAAAGLALTLGVSWSYLGDRGEPDFKVKGLSNVLLYVKRDQKTRLFQAGMELRNGDGVSAEVFAVEPTVTFIGAYDGRGRLLSSPDSFLAYSESLDAGESRVLKSSFELVGENEQESIMVFSCSEASFREDFSDLSSFLGLVQDLPDLFVPEAVTESCRVFTFKLR